MVSLIGISGGPGSFVGRLDLTFEPGVIEGNNQFGNTIFNPSNEPSFSTPYLYNFINRQAQSVRRSRFVAKNFYHLAPDGLPGNSDAGAMESWLLWSMIGMYPMTGQTTFLIGSPWFENLAIHLESGFTLEIKAKGGSENVFYVQSLKVNGKDWDRNWVTWEDVFERGGTLEFVLGPEPVQWDTGDLPPSPGSEHDAPPEKSSRTSFHVESAVWIVAGVSGLLATALGLLMMARRDGPAKGMSATKRSSSTFSTSLMGDDQLSIQGYKKFRK
jgi:putative alpha-1,2-mannosidase